MWLVANRLQILPGATNLRLNWRKPEMLLPSATEQLGGR
jgi:hypothetical protein